MVALVAPAATRAPTLVDHSDLPKSFVCIVTAVHAAKPLYKSWLTPPMRSKPLCFVRLNAKGWFCICRCYTDRTYLSSHPGETKNRGSLTNRR